MVKQNKAIAIAILLGANYLPRKEEKNERKKERKTERERKNSVSYFSAWAPGFTDSSGSNHRWAE